MNKSGIRKWGLMMLLILGIFLLQSSIAYGVEWAKDYTFYKGVTPYNVSLKSIQQTSDGGYVAAGLTQISWLDGYAYADVLILKLDGNGNIQWQKAYGGPDRAYYASSIQQTSDGGYVVAGETGWQGYALVLKLDGNGDAQWQKIYSGTDVIGYSANSVQQTSDGGYVVAGETYTPGVTYGSGNAWVLKLDGNGNIQWQKAYNAPICEPGSCCNSFYKANSIQQTSDGTYIVAGAIAIIYPDKFLLTHGLVLKLDGSGNVQRMKDYSNNSFDSIQQTSDGGYIVGGNITLKLDESGNIQWLKTFIVAKQQTSDGGYVGVDVERVWKVNSNGEIPDCSIIGALLTTVSDLNATITTTNVIGIDTNISPQTRITSVANTNVQVRNVCPERVCNLVPDSISIPRGGTLGFQTTLTNNTGGAKQFLFATTVTLPNGNKYPPSNYLIGPLSILLNPYQSKSAHRSHTIPLSAPLGNYIYHGYIGWPGVGIYNKCQFNFEVTE